MNLFFVRMLMSILLVIFVSIAGKAQDKTAIMNGNWNSGSTWNPTGVPGDNQVILIPPGTKVTVKGTDHTLYNSIMVIEGEMIMESTCGICLNYGSLTFTGPASGVFIEEGGKVTDGTALGGDSHFIEVQGDTFWSGDNCTSNCGTHIGNQTAPAGGVAGPLGMVNPLPVEMLYFTGKYDDGGALLNWATATELNNSHFEIERSVDDFQFQKIGEVKGNGNSNTRVEYSFKDQEIPITSSRLYYRIKQVDFDGKYEYFDIVSVYNKMLDLMEVRTCPNPFDEQLTIFLRSSSPDNVMVRLYNIEGQEVFSHFYPINKGLNELKIDELYDSPPGIYFLSLMGNSLNFKEKVIKVG